MRRPYAAVALVAALLAAEATAWPSHTASSPTVSLTPQQQATKNAICTQFYENAGAPNRVSLQSMATDCPGEAL